MRKLLKLMRKLLKLMRKALSPTPAGNSSDGAERPNCDEKYSLVRERVERYRDDLVLYRLGYEHHRRKVSRDALLEILDGREQVLSHPILYLNSDDWKWDPQELQEAVTRTLRDLGLHGPTDVREPTSQAKQACDAWAVKEAKKLFDEKLGSNAQK